MKTWRSTIEPLEPRIAPASVVVTYTDVDGDLVKITDSSGHLTSADLSFVGGGPGGQLAELNLTASGFAGANITFSVIHKPGGNGLANVGFVNATGVKLGSVTVKGDLGRIDAGNGTGTAIKSLSVNSLGRLGLDSQSGLGTTSQESAFSGSLGPLTVAHDDAGAYINVTNGGITSVTIGGSLIGGTSNNSGEILSTGNIGAVKIGHDVVGGVGNNSGEILASNGTLASATISGSVIGGSGDHSGEIFGYVNLGAVKIGHDVLGGAGAYSGAIRAYRGTLTSATISGSLSGGSNSHAGEIYSSGNMGAVKIGHDVLGGVILTHGTLASATIGGSLIGGSNSHTGQISSEGNMGAVKIGHDVVGGAGNGSGIILTDATLKSATISGSLVGGSGTNSGEIYGRVNIGAVTIGENFSGGSISGTTGSLDSSGLIYCAQGSIASVDIAGSVITGTDTSTASGAVLTTNASIRAGQEIDSLTVAGSLIGNPDGGTGNAASPVVISAAGLLDASANTDLAIGKMSIGGRVEDAVILAGYNVILSPTNGSAQIGSVKVAGDWIASDLVAGATNSDTPSGAPFPNFGTTDDAVASGGTAGILSKIASITIGGQVIGTPASVNETDNFGFVAQAIGPVSIGGYSITITSGNTPQPVGETGDVDIHILA